MSSTELQHVPAPGDDDFMFLSAVSDAPEYGPVNRRHCPATGDGLQVFIGSVATHELVGFLLYLSLSFQPPSQPHPTLTLRLMTSYIEIPLSGVVRYLGTTIG